MNITEAIEEHISVVESVKNQFCNEISSFGKMCADVISNGNTIYFMGNGGSASDSQHLAAEFVGRFVNERKGLPAIALTTDTSILTAIGNDYGYQNIFRRQIEALVDIGDLVVGISTSGNSDNVVKAIELAKEKGAFTVGLSGKDGGILSKICDLCITIPSNNTARIQECHIMIGHIVCGIVDEVFGNDK